MQAQFAYLFIDLRIIPSTFKKSSIQSFHCVWHGYPKSGRWNQVDSLPAAEVLLFIFFHCRFQKNTQTVFPEINLGVIECTWISTWWFLDCQPLIFRWFAVSFVNMLKFRHVRPTITPPKKILQLLYFSRNLENGYEKRMNILSLEIQRPFPGNPKTIFLEWYCRKDCSFSKGWFHQQFQGNIILMVASQLPRGYDYPMIVYVWQCRHFNLALGRHY